MKRTLNRPGRGGKPDSIELEPKPIRLARLSENHVRSSWDMVMIRGVFTAICIASAYHFRPFALSAGMAAVLGLLFAAAVILFEIRLRSASLTRLIGAVIGSILGILGAYLTHLVLDRTSIPMAERSFLSVAVLLVMAYVGLIVGANKGEMLNLQALGGLFGAERTAMPLFKVFDTSVIIDGRVADICEAHFLDGVLLIPQFVLRELQLVADSADPLKRQRGRRGLEVLQRIQKMPQLDVQIAEDDFPQVTDVDMKLIELAKRYDAKIITNDYNLNKVATLQGLEVLNVNQLANALKPVVLPGESMRVFILREGKEYNQGVAYLDDGTMVVVDGARKMINRTVDVSVTSVHQTTAGKMIFGRYDERAEQQARQPVATVADSEGARPATPEGRVPERGGEAQQGSERPPRPVLPEPTRD